MRVWTMVALVGLAACKSEQDLIPPNVNVGVGEPPPPVNPIQTDRILQLTEPAVDIVFVIDNSCSMSEEQALLAANFPAFYEYFENSGLDYHIGVISTDMEEGTHTGKLQERAGQRYITRDSPNPEAVFSQMVQLGTGGWFEERGRDALYTALELRVDGPENDGFYRLGAALTVVFVSDENDQSVLISRDEFYEWAEALKGAPDQVTMHAIVAPNLDGQCASAFEVGGAYLGYADRFGGTRFSICEADWEPMLDNIGLQASGLRREYFLTSIPVVSTLEVSVITPDDGEGGGGVVLEFNVCQAGQEETDLDCEVIYVPSRNSVAFLDYLPPPLSEVVVTYLIQEAYTADPTLADDGQ